MATRRVLSTLADSSRRNIASFTSTTHNRFVNKSLFTTTPSSSPLNVMQARSMSGGFWSDLKNKVGSEMNKDKDNDKNMQEIEEMRQKAMEQLATAKSNMENSDTLNKVCTRY